MITINIIEDEFKIFGDKYELAQHIVQEYLESNLIFKNYHFFSLEKIGKKINLILYDQKNKDFLEFSLILKKYLDNCLFM